MLNRKGSELMYRRYQCLIPGSPTVRVFTYPRCLSRRLIHGDSGNMTPLLLKLQKAPPPLLLGPSKGANKQKPGRGGVQVNKKRGSNKPEFSKMAGSPLEELRRLRPEVYEQVYHLPLDGDFHGS